MIKLYLTKNFTLISAKVHIFLQFSIPIIFILLKSYFLKFFISNNFFSTFITYLQTVAYLDNFNNLQFDLGFS